MRRSGRPVRFAVLAVLAAGAALLLPAATTLPSVASQAREDTRLGFVTWDCDHSQPVAWIRLDLLGTPEEAATRAHEADHLRVMRAFGSCEAYQAWIKEPGAAAALEASAFCAGSRAAHAGGRFQTLERAIDHYASRLTHGYPLGLSFAQSRMLIRVACKLETPPPPAAGSHAGPTLLVTNESLDALTICVDGWRAGWVQAGRSECLVIPAQALSRRVRLTAGGPGGQVSYSTDESLGAQQGWTWTLGKSASASWLVPARRPCVPRS